MNPSRGSVDSQDQGGGEEEEEELYDRSTILKRKADHLTSNVDDEQEDRAYGHLSIRRCFQHVSTGGSCFCS